MNKLHLLALKPSNTVKIQRILTVFGALKILLNFGAEKLRFSRTENRSLQKSWKDFCAPKILRIFERFSSENKKVKGALIYYNSPLAISSFK